MAQGNSLRILKNIISEVRCNSSGKARSNPIISYVFNQYRKYQVTDLQYCKAQEEMLHLAKTYLCYLRSQRKYAEIHESYHAKGERTIKETADMVGFKLPHDPK